MLTENKTFLSSTHLIMPMTLFTDPLMVACNITQTWMDDSRRSIMLLLMKAILRSRSMISDSPNSKLFLKRRTLCFFSSYSICIRRELGYCCVQYSVCADDEDSGFTLGVVGNTMSFSDNDCGTTDFVGIEGK